MIRLYLWSLMAKSQKSPLNAPNIAFVVGQHQIFLDILILFN